MKRTGYIIIIVGIGLIAMAAFATQSARPALPSIASTSPSAATSSGAASSTTSTGKKPIADGALAAPMDNALARVTKKPFGIYVDPKSSPVSPEKFTGYHTGVDFEAFANEQDADVAVGAICTGTILQKRTAQGYGGMMVQVCTLNGDSITVVYGHIRLSGASAAIGDTVKAGEFLAYLGKGYSVETGGERKHLHLGVHKGAAPDTRGYVQSKSLLVNWLDVRQYLK